MKLSEKREIEKLKYDKLYHPDGRPQYGDWDHSKGIRDYIVFTLKPESVIDIGCGGGQFVDFCKSYNIKARGVDISSPYDIIAPAHKIPFKDKSFEYLTCFDMMEHLVEEEVDEVIKEYVRIAVKGMIFKICYRASHGKGVDGEVLHPTVKPEKWWVEKLLKHSNMNLQKKGAYLIIK